MANQSQSRGHKCFMLFRSLGFQKEKIASTDKKRNHQSTHPPLSFELQVPSLEEDLLDCTVLKDRRFRAQLLLPLQSASFYQSLFVTRVLHYLMGREA